MAAIRPCTGTTADWEAVADTLILKEREIGVEIDADGHYLVRKGDGKNKFFRYCHNLFCNCFDVCLSVPDIRLYGNDGADFRQRK